MFFIKVIFTAEGAEREYGGLCVLSGLCGLQRLQGAGERKKYFSQSTQSTQNSCPKTQELLRGKDNRLNDYHILPVNANSPNPVRKEFDEIPGA